MSDLYHILKTVSSAGFVMAINRFQIESLPRPSWINADRVTLIVYHYESNAIRVEFELCHHTALLKFGSDPATVRSMKVLCHEEWFPDNRQRFSKIAECFDLQWHSDADIDDDVIPCCIYTLNGSFSCEAADRVIALLFAIRATLQES